MSRDWSNSDAAFRKAIDAEDDGEHKRPRFVFVTMDGAFTRESSYGGEREKFQHGFAIYERRGLSVASLRYYERSDQFTVEELDRRELVKRVTGLEARDEEGGG